MLRVVKILSIKPYTISCLFNNGARKSIDVSPLLKKHNHLEGIEKLKDEKVFNTASIGQFGEIYWPDIILNPTTGDIWNYDISPEFIYYNDDSKIKESGRLT